MEPYNRLKSLSHPRYDLEMREQQPLNEDQTLPVSYENKGSVAESTSYDNTIGNHQRQNSDVNLNPPLADNTAVSPCDNTGSSVTQHGSMTDNSAITRAHSQCDSAGATQGPRFCPGDSMSPTTSTLQQICDSVMSQQERQSESRPKSSTEQREGFSPRSTTGSSKGSTGMSSPIQNIRSPLMETIKSPQPPIEIPKSPLMETVKPLESDESLMLYKCTNCAQAFMTQNEFIAHLTCQAAQVMAGSSGGGCARSAMAPGDHRLSVGSSRDDFRSRPGSKFGPVSKQEGLGQLGLNFPPNSYCEEVTSSTGRGGSHPQRYMFSDLLVHQCQLCKEAFGSAETLSYHRSQCTGGKGQSCGIPMGEASGSRDPPTWPFRQPGEPELIDLTGPDVDVKPRPLSPQSATELQKVPCEICGKRYKNKYTLKTHYRVHSTQRPFTCIVCQKSFKEKGVLKSHEKTHSDERPFACPVCFKQFKAKGTLQTHIKQIHPNWTPPVRFGNF